MSLRTFLIASVSALFGLCVAFMLVGSTAAQLPLAQAAPALVGRYQMAPWFGNTGTQELFVIDTATGECWQRTSGNPTWQSLLLPILPKTK
jgi:hypothetical protein